MGSLKAATGAELGGLSRRRKILDQKTFEI